MRFWVLYWYTGCMANKEMEKVYEVSFHLVPTIPSDAVSGVFERIKGGIAKDGEILSEVFPVLRDLAYTIRHTVRQGDGSYNRYTEAYFGSVKFRSLREHSNNVARMLQDDEEVLRSLLLETVAEDTRIGEVLPDVEAEAEAAAAAAGGDSENGKDKEGNNGVVVPVKEGGEGGGGENK